MKFPSISVDRVLMGLLCVSVGLNLLHAYKPQIKMGATAPGALLWDPGTNAPPVAAHNLNGEPVLLEFDNQPASTLLYLFSPSCRWCEHNAKDVQALERRLPPSVRFVRISTSVAGLPEFLSLAPLSAPTYLVTARARHAAYRFGAVPQTLLIHPTGTVRGRWGGNYTPSVLGEIERAIGIGR